MSDIERLTKRITALEGYLVSCVDERDWHGVSDAANDLREADVELGWAKRLAMGPAAAATQPMVNGFTVDTTTLPWTITG